MIDLRSDTLTRPSEEMRRVMASAPVGDDVYGEDPSINALQEKAAEIIGKEAALFVPTGTMGNQIAAKVHTTPASEIILADITHLFTAEAGAVAAISGVTLNLRRTERGILDPADAKSAIRRNDLHSPRSRLIWIENTHNLGGGSVYPIETVKALSALAHSNGMALHMDGARIFNAAIASGVPASEYASHCDSLIFCLSKGLGCPVGSMVAGSRAFVDEAMRWRKILGGGMRQAGILAAAGLYALENNIERLAEDHANAKLLARKIAAHKCAAFDAAEVETNIIMARFTEDISADKLVAGAAERNVLFSPRSAHSVRFVTHLDVSAEECGQAADIVLEILDKLSA